jgi:hypothetical protein
MNTIMMLKHTGRRRLRRLIQQLLWPSAHDAPRSLIPSAI